jgi:alpha-galactosidase
MKIRILVFFSFFLLSKIFAQSVNFVEGWKFKTGDNQEWAKPDFDDRDWAPILTEVNYELQGFAEYDGYSWYRLKFFLPNKVKESASLKERVKILLGKIDDVDRVFLNGVKIAQTGSFPDEKGGFQSSSEVFRKYIIEANDPAIRWNQENVIAIRVYDGNGNGGLFGGNIGFEMMGVMDYLSMNTNIETWDMSRRDSMFKKVILKNNYEKDVRVTFQTTNIDPYGHRTGAAVGYKIKAKDSMNVLAKMPRIENASIEFSLMEMKTMKMTNVNDFTPYILTPKAPLSPRINAPSVYGASPNSDFYYLLPISGERPMKITVKSLPKGLVFDESTGLITGKTPQKGDYKLKITAQNSQGKTAAILKIKIGEDIYLTPPMGWNSRVCWGVTMSDEKIENAKALIKSGLDQYGFTFVNIQDSLGNSKKVNTPNEKFPTLKGFFNQKSLRYGAIRWDEKLCSTEIFPSEKYSGVTLWAMFSAPMLLGCEVTKMDDFTLNLVTNNEVNAINQDELLQQATKIKTEKDLEFWVKDLANGDKALAIFNLGKKEIDYPLDAKSLGLDAFQKTRDVWRQKDFLEKNPTLKIFSHGVVLLRFSK